MKVKLEEIKPDADSSFRILLTPNLQDLFYWHFHPEYEIVYVEAERGIRHIGDHISNYEKDDLVLIGPNIPHLNFDFGVRTECEQVIVQMKEDFMGSGFFNRPELSDIAQLFERARGGLVFYGKTKEAAATSLKALTGQSHFDQLIGLLNVFQLLAASDEYENLHVRPLANASLLKEQKRMHLIYHFIETHYQQPIDIHAIAAAVHLSTPAFCRYFKKSTHLTFTEFVNRYRINEAKKILINGSNVTDACYQSGFENLSHFNKTFRKLAGENPSQFRKKHLVS